jgi:hypothetical protein
MVTSLPYFIISIEHGHYPKKDLAENEKILTSAKINDYNSFRKSQRRINPNAVSVKDFKDAKPSRGVLSIDMLPAV